MSFTLLELKKIVNVCDKFNMFRNIGIWNSLNFNAKKVAKVAHPLREGPGGPGAQVLIPFNLVPRDLEKLGSLASSDHSEGNNENVEKEIGLIGNATTLHMQHAVTTARPRSEIPSSRTAFHEGSKHTRTSQFCFYF